MNKESTGDTGTRNETFNIVSVLYHSLQSAETIDKYLQDSGQTGGSDITKFLQETKEENMRCADRAKQLLAEQLGNSRAKDAGK